jgi:hypothetical protein
VIIQVILFGFFAFMALYFLYIKLPLSIKKFLKKAPFLSELLSLVFFYLTITSVTRSIIGVFSSLFAGFLWTLYFFFERKE